MLRVKWYVAVTVLALACQPLKSNSLQPNHTDILKKAIDSLPSEGASVVVFQVHDIEQRGWFWLAVDWESPAFSFSQAQTFVGITKHGDTFVSERNAAEWKYVDPGTAPGGISKRNIAEWIPTLMLVEAAQRFPDDTIVRRISESTFEVETIRPIFDDGHQSIKFGLDSQGRVTSFQGVDPYRTQPISFEYADVEADAMLAIVPSRIIRKLGENHEVMFVRTSATHQSISDDGLFQPERAAAESTRAKRHSLATAVPGIPKQFQANENPDDQSDTVAADSVNALLVTEVEPRSKAKSTAIIIAGGVLMMLAVAAGIRRHMHGSP